MAPNNITTTITTIQLSREHVNHQAKKNPSLDLDRRAIKKEDTQKIGTMVRQILLQVARWLSSSSFSGDTVGERRLNGANGVRSGYNSGSGGIREGLTQFLERPPGGDSLGRCKLRIRARMNGELSLQTCERMVINADLSFLRAQTVRYRFPFYLSWTIF